MCLPTTLTLTQPCSSPTHRATVQRTAADLIQGNPLLPLALRTLCTQCKGTMNRTLSATLDGALDGSKQQLQEAWNRFEPQHGVN